MAARRADKATLEALLLDAARAHAAPVRRLRGRARPRACAYPARQSSTCRCGNWAMWAGLPTGGSPATRNATWARGPTRMCRAPSRTSPNVARAATASTTPAPWPTTGAGSSPCPMPRPRGRSSKPAWPTRWRCCRPPKTTTRACISTAWPCSTKTCTPRPRSTWRRRWALIRVKPPSCHQLLHPPSRRCAWPAPRWMLGSSPDGFVFDNELGAHAVPVAAFEIDAQPVRWSQFLHFVEQGGYRERRCWSDAGWQLVTTQRRHRTALFALDRHGLGTAAPRALASIEPRRSGLPPHRF